nr:receptor-like serine/threonine-protein kinase SD1-7 [Ipomoea trifida]
MSNVVRLLCTDHATPIPPLKEPAFVASHSNANVSTSDREFWHLSSSTGNTLEGKLLDGRKNIIWSTNISDSELAGNPVEAYLQNNENLILKQGDSPKKLPLPLTPCTFPKETEKSGHFNFSNFLNSSSLL